MTEPTLTATLVDRLPPFNAAIALGGEAIDLWFDCFLRLLDLARDADAEVNPPRQTAVPDEKD